VKLLERAQNAQRLFAKQSASEKKRLLNFLLSNCTWKDGTLTGHLCQPFDLIAEPAMLAAQAPSAEGQNLDEHPVWLGELDAYRTFCRVLEPDMRAGFPFIGGLGVVGVSEAFPFKSLDKWHYL
jgi:hypothetical protein